MHRSYVFFIFWLIVNSLWSQYNEKEILLRQANQLSSRRKYESANQIYKKLLAKYPQDYQIAERLISNYLINSKIFRADSLLECKKEYFPQINYTIQRITIDLSRGEIKKADKTADKYFNANPGKVSDYRIIATIFEIFRHYEIALIYYEKARQISRDHSIYAKEMAIDLQYLKKYKEAIFEYTNYLKKNVNYQHFVLNQFKQILNEDISQLKYMKAQLSNTDNQVLLELYALTLAHLKKFAEALEIYKKLDPKKLLLFADQQIVQNNLEIALQAYLNYIDLINEPYYIVDAKIKIAQIYLLNNELDPAKKYLLQIFGDEKIQSNMYRYKTYANQLCREMLAEIAVRQNESEENVLKYYKDAKKFSYNLNDKYLLEYKIVHYLMMKKEYERSRNALKFLIAQQEKGTQTYNLGFYYSYLLSVFTDDQAADSLLTELMINIPENDMINDALWISKMLNSLNNESKEIFFKAYQYKELYKTQQAIDLLYENRSQNEDFLILALEWAKKYGFHELMKKIVPENIKDEDYFEYVQLMKNEIELDQVEKQTNVKDFLKKYPNSVFSPSFRKLLSQSER